MKIKSLSSTLFLVAPLVAEALPAFPEASGAGATSVGGRGGVICEVINLNDTGTGSLRACTDAAGPRIVVFRVSGTIQLEKDIVIRNPYITIAGQTAPGGGITLSGKNSTNDVFTVKSHDIVVRYIRMRKGYNTITPLEAGDGISIAGGNNIIFDHCSVSWAMDENIGVWGNTSFPVPSNLTFSWNLVAEGLSGHVSRQFLTGAGTSSLAETMSDIDAHHNLFAHSYERNPLIKNKTFRFVNNIVYNWGRSATRLGGGVSLDAIGNLYKVGPLNGTYSPSSVYEIQVFPTPNTTTPSGSPSLYVVGNIGPHNANPNNDNWILVKQIASEGGTIEGQQLPVSYKRTSPLPALAVPIIVYPADQLENVIPPAVGASHRLDCLGNWVSNRDAVDTRIVQEYSTNKGIMPNTENDVGGFPIISNEVPCQDTDRDGMPDAWEDANGLKKNDPSDGQLVHSDGYTNVERYLNGFNAETILAPTHLRFIQP